jgi:cytosine/adenosine deaminase-related metal-dependent hydrolase
MSHGITLRARHILPMASPPLENGWIRIERGRIVALGRREPPGHAVDLGDAIVLPGLVNAHTHLEFSDLPAPLSGEGGLPGWIGRVVALRRARPSGPAEVARLRKAVAAGLRETAAAGVTSVGDIATAALPAPAATIGPRVRAYREALGLSAAANGDHGLARDLDRLAAAGFQTGISPHAPYSVAVPLGRRLLREARRRRLPVAMHLAESREEAELLATGSGGFRRLLEDLGAWDAADPPRLLAIADWISLLARSPRGIVVHGTFLPEDPPAIARLSRHRDRLGVVVCPRTTQSLSGTLPPVAAFRAAGIRVAIGTDSRASNPDLGVLAECRTLVAGGLASPADALAMATRHGAWALLRERRAGILAPGRPADLAILRPAGRHDDPHGAAIDPATQVVATLRSGRVIAGALPEPR